MESMKQPNPSGEQPSKDFPLLTNNDLASLAHWATRNMEIVLSEEGVNTEEAHRRLVFARWLVTHGYLSEE